MSKINYFKFLFLVLLTSHSLLVSQVLDQLSINLEKVDLRSVNDSLIKYKWVNPQKAIQYGFYALNTFADAELSLGIVNTNYYLAEAFFIMGDNKSSFEHQLNILKPILNSPSKLQLLAAELEIMLYVRSGNVNDAYTKIKNLLKRPDISLEQKSRLELLNKIYISNAK